MGKWVGADQDKPKRPWYKCLSEIPFRLTKIQVARAASMNLLPKLNARQVMMETLPLPGRKQRPSEHGLVTSTRGQKISQYA